MPINYHTLPGDDKCVTYYDRAEALLAKFPGVNRDELLIALTADALLNLRHGNKREERAACDFLNLLQAEALKQIQDNTTKTP
jgi:hypothetical protein